jgi:uncharacterized repeat protein (TIGR01451 family)
VVDQLADEYAAAGETVVFLEQNVDNPLGSRVDRWWAAYGGGGSVYLPLNMVDSGQYISNSYLGSSAHDTYKAMVDAELARPAQAEVVALAQRVGNSFHFEGQLTNLSGVTLSSGNSATVHAIVYEEHTPVDLNVDHITGRIVRAAVSGPISSLAHGATTSFVLDTAELSSIVDWDKVHTVVLVDYRPGGPSGAYDMLQATSADAEAGLRVSKRAEPATVAPGELLTYTVRIANTGDRDLHATVTDTLSAHVTYTGALVWTPTITAPGGTWEHTFAVTVELGYTGPLTNLVEVATEEGATGRAIVIVNAYKIYLPLVVRSFP